MTITIGIQKRLATPNIYLPDSIASTSRRVRTNPTGETPLVGAVLYTPFTSFTARSKNFG
ncbi:Uncharacterised protein [Mycobacterium tuberculosis]|nr:Uncharacterised protein [Mycobacterium tuberculosis]